jgi:hypothetical protein
MTAKWAKGQTPKRGPKAAALIWLFGHLVLWPFPVPP